MVAIYCYLQRGDDKILKFYIKNSSDLETGASLY